MTPKVPDQRGAVARAERSARSKDQAAHARALKALGNSIKDIASHLQVQEQTVRRYLADQKEPPVADFLKTGGDAVYVPKTQGRRPADSKEEPAPPDQQESSRKESDVVANALAEQQKREYVALLGGRLMNET
jgi:predicted transcriptional regulator